jgi:hypothetical protein
MHAEAVYEGLTADDASARRVLQDLLLALTTPQGTRRTCRFDELAGPSAHPSSRSVLEALERSRLVVAEEGGLTLAHEALLVQWTRLRAWIAVAREDRLLAEEIEREAMAWSESPSDERVWRKRRLVAAQDLDRRGAIKLSPTSVAFVKAGRRAERQTRVLMGAAGVAIVISATISGLLYVKNVGAERRAAESARDAFRGAAELADNNAKQAAAAERRANIEKQRADEQTRVANAANSRAELFIATMTKLVEQNKLDKVAAQLRGRANAQAGDSAADPKQPTRITDPPPRPPPITSSTAYTGPGDPP